MGGRPHTADFSRNGNLSISSLPPRHPNSNNGSPSSQHNVEEPVKKTNSLNLSAEPGDVLNDIGNMLANLTDELDAML